VSWDAFQREALGALGHTLYRRADAQAPSSPEPVDAPPATAAITALQRALLRAAGRRDPADADLRSLLATASGLRADPVAKRALWPRLRALRRDAHE
jgi:hypothetical protein